jgi:flagellum-specific ATP synthase
LDGHVVLDRAIAERGRFPAVNILRSVSRVMPACNSTEQNIIIDRTRQLVSVYEDMAELIRLGAYRQGSDSKVDEAIHYNAAIEEFLSQKIEEATDLDACYAKLAQILDLNVEEGDVNIENDKTVDEVEEMHLGSPVENSPVENNEIVDAVEKIN